MNHLLFVIRSSIHKNVILTNHLIVNEIIVIKIIIKITVVKIFKMVNQVSNESLWDVIGYRYDVIMFFSCPFSLKLVSPTRKSTQKECNNPDHNTNTF